MGYHGAKARVLLIFRDRPVQVCCMKRYAPFICAFAVLVITAIPASAACFADYKAKKDNPLRLHYGVIEVDANPCRLTNSVRRSVADRISAAGWQLLQIESVFDDSGLARRQSDAGRFFLRF